MIINNNENKTFEPIDKEEIEYARVIKELKKTNKRLYETEIAGEKILWRPLTRAEFKDAWSIPMPEDASDWDILFDRETYIAEHVVLYPDDAVENIACCAEIITDLCMSKSGFIEKRDPKCKEV